MTEKKELLPKTKTRPPIWRAMKNLEAIIGHEFGQHELLELALTHSSWANEHPATPANNERLEFLGDAVLELCVSDELYRRFPQAREGAMTQMRSQLVNENTLAQIALDIGVDVALRLGRGEERQDGRQKKSLLSDTLEAILGAVFLDGGFGAAQKTVSRLFEYLWSEVTTAQKEPDPKTRLQETCLKLFGQTPNYLLESTTGPPHARTFRISLHLPDGRKLAAENTSQKKAEQTAAAVALQLLGNT